MQDSEKSTVESDNRVLPSSGSKVLVSSPVKCGALNQMTSSSDTESVYDVYKNAQHGHRKRTGCDPWLLAPL